ncbi:unnamed protein product [Strongylus vulgaris]|uniref:Uncharacterized protein n=1 Tax=Strongylus vulgaris TaxID=40348 RepID=A0A3P7IVR0_STRVU|nr:unnamed protein product [Strongylus vulgaris]
MKAFGLERLNARTSGLEKILKATKGLREEESTEAESTASHPERLPILVAEELRKKTWNIGTRNFRKQHKEGEVQ